MKKVALVLGVLASAALVGCAKSDTEAKYDAPKPLDKMSTEEWCGYYQNFLTNPQLTPQARQIDLQRMHARGCPGV